MKPIVLCILDGFGIGYSKIGNAIAHANTPVFDYMFKSFSHSVLHASGTYVGLPMGQMGNSEVGHLTIGSGRVILQTLPRISYAIESGVFKENKNLISVIKSLLNKKRSMHFVGLFSSGGVHSLQDHAIAYANIFLQHGVNVVFHIFLDGRDTAQCSALDSLKWFQEKLPKTNIATCCGRYYGMDRDQNIERTKQAVSAIIFGDGIRTEDSWPIMIEKSYFSGTTDEFIKPHVQKGYQGVTPGDGLFLFNFRADRMRQIAKQLIDFPFDQPLSMVEYDSSLTSRLTPLFPLEPVEKSFGEVISDYGMKQLRLAETEKYAHVTFFLNGGSNHIFPGEDRVLIPSKKVSTYDMCPAMSAIEITDQLTSALSNYDVIIVNYANADMVGHTGVFSATVSAIESIDLCLGRVLQAIQKINGTLIITADHGNAECMFDNNHDIITAHTVNPVPMVICRSGVRLRNGCLADVAPTILRLMDIPQPIQMTGVNLNLA